MAAVPARLMIIGPDGEETVVLHKQRFTIGRHSGNDLKLRAGIDTGTVSSGLVGRATLAYDMWGSAVNIAYQVQSGSPQPGIYVTSRVYDVMRDTRDFSPAGEVTGDDDVEPVWRLSEREP